MASRPSANERAVRVLTGGETTTRPSRPHHDGRPRRDWPLYSGHVGWYFAIIYKIIIFFCLI